MKTRTKKMLSLLLATAMVFTMNTVAFAEEVDEAAIDSVEAVEVTDAVIDEIAEEVVIAEEAATPSSNSANGLSADSVLSANAAAISDNLAATTTDILAVGNDKYIIQFPKAIAFGGKKKFKADTKALKVEVYKYTGTKATVSEADIISDNGTLVSADKVAVKKVKVKASKGATVDLTGKGIVPLKSATYIASIKLEDKEANKAFGKAFKDYIKTNVKKEKTKTVSAGNVEVNFVTAVYPAYAGNDEAAVKIAKDAKLAVVESLDTSKMPKKITGTLDGKKVTLKPTKKEGKYKGISSVKTTDTSAKGKTVVVCDGDFAGNIFY